jgi:periplasmic divalent cation tolerance protein
MKFESAAAKVVLAYCTFPDEATAQRICEILVAEGTIACANILGPMQSIYKWDGKLNKEKEWGAILKTSALKQAMLKERIRATHPYSNPCLVFLKIEDGLPDFLNWIYNQSL